MDQCGHCTLKGNLSECEKAPCSHRETWYAIEQQKRNDILCKTLDRVQQDINWMLNNRTFLNDFVFDYIEDALSDNKT